MATINPIQAGPLKITFPANLPKNEKDLICMLLAGRLKDLLNGKLVCAQLAIDDLIKDLTGVSPLSELKQGLMDLKSTLNDLRSATGYDNILNAVNQGLAQIGNVFSLGGLCPSPVTPPKIPDVLSQLNNNLMGQMGNILNALAKASNPSMCLGGGPGGFGVNWNSMTGDLKNLKAAIANFKRDPAGYNATMTAFKKNINGQTNRLKSELKRLEKNLTDPFGIKDKQKTVHGLMSAKNKSDGYKVKDSRGIEQTVLKAMVPADIEHVLARTSSIDASPIVYKTRPVLDYCGEVVGYEKYSISGDINYSGWDTNPDANNGLTPTTNPVGTQADFDFLFTLENSSIVIYNTSGTRLSEINLTRGQLYRIGLELDSNSTIKFYTDSSFTTPWVEGLTYSKDPEYGHGIEVITPDVSTTYMHGEIDWAVLLEEPTTPNTLYWKSINGQSGTLVIDGATAIPYADRVYDLSMAAKKAFLHIAKTSITIPDSVEVVNSEADIRTRMYDVVTNVYNNGTTTTNSTLKFSDSTLSIIDELDDSGYATGNKVIKSISKYTSNQYLITKRVVNEQSGLTFNKINFYISNTVQESDATYCVFFEFVDPLVILNSSKLQYTDHYSYKLTLVQKDGDTYIPVATVNNSDSTTFELVVPSDDVYLIRWNLTNNTEVTKASTQFNDFVFQTDIQIDPADKKRTFVDSDPAEYRTYFYFKFKDFAFDSTITLNPVANTEPAAAIPTTKLEPSATISPGKSYGLSLIFG